MAEPQPRRYERTVTEIDELRTVGFRLREIQRLLSMRVEQENRRLEAEGLDPVSEPGIDGEEARSGHDRRE